MGVSQAEVYLWETDRSRPRDANLSALCKVLKLSVRATKAMAAARPVLAERWHGGKVIAIAGSRIA